MVRRCPKGNARILGYDSLVKPKKFLLYHHWKGLPRGVRDITIITWKRGKPSHKTVKRSELGSYCMI